MQILNFFQKHHIVLKNRRLVVASSGGPDSMALLDQLQYLRQKINFTIIVAHFDHQLRPDSFQETRLLKEYCQTRHLCLVVGKWPKEQQPQKGIEAAARKARYNFLLKVVRARQADYLLTAHQNDDLIENILLKFIRSGNPEEMNGLQPISQMHGLPLLRPLLNISKNKLLAYDHQQHLPFIEDQTNLTDSTMRNRLRHNVVPLLKKENPHLGANAVRYSHQMELFTHLTVRNWQKIKPKKFLGVAYRLRASKLASFSLTEQSLFWQHFIWITWHRRVNPHLPGFHLLTYQHFSYLWKDSLLNYPQRQALILGQAFDYGSRRLILQTHYRKKGKLIGQFQSSTPPAFIGPLVAGQALLLNNGKHARPKKKFAQAGIPAFLRPFCSTIFDAHQRVLFIEKTYRNPFCQNHGRWYYLYLL